MSDMQLAIGSLDGAALQAQYQEFQRLLVSLRGQEIQNDADLETANFILRRVVTEEDALKEKKEAITKPLNASLGAARGLFRPSEDILGQLKTVLKSLIGGYDLKRQKQYRELYAKAATAATEGRDREASQALVQAATAMPTKVAGTSVRFQWKAEVINAGMVPPNFLIPDTVAISAYARSVPSEQQPEPIPGVKFTLEPIVSVKR